MFLIREMVCLFQRKFCISAITIIIFLHDVNYVTSEPAKPAPFPFLGSIIHNTQDVIHKIIPLPHRSKPRALPLVQGIFNLIPGGNNILHGIGNVLDSFEAKPPTTTTTTTTTTPAPRKGFFWWLQPPPPPKPTTTTTELPTPPGGRGLSGLIYNAENAFTSLLELKDIAEFQNPHWVPGYGAKKVQDFFNSLVAVRDIIKQRHLHGGLNEIVNNTRDVFKNLGDINKLMKSNAPGHMLYMGFTMTDLLKHIGALKDNFMIKFPPMTTPAPGIDFGNLPLGVEPLNKEDLYNNSTDVMNAYKSSGDFGVLMLHTERLLRALSRIEEELQRHNPNSTILQQIGKFKKQLEDAYNNSKSMDNQDILEVIQKFFPHNSLAHVIGEIGKLLTHVFPKSELAITLGNLLQQEMIVNLVLDNLKNIGIGLKVGTIKDSMIQTAGKIGNRLLQNDPSHAILHTVESLERRAVSFQSYLKLIEAFVDKLKANMTQGKFFQQLPSKLVSIFSDKETFELLIQTALQLVHLIPIDFIKDIADIMSSLRTDLLAGGPVRRAIFYGGPLRRFIFSGGPVRQLLRGKGPLAYLLHSIFRPSKKGMRSTKA